MLKSLPRLSVLNCSSRKLIRNNFILSVKNITLNGNIRNTFNKNISAVYYRPISSIDQQLQTINPVTPIQLQCKRFYAKRNMGGRKESGKKSKESVKVDLSSDDVHDIVDIDKMKGQMDTTINYLKKELTEQLALRLSLSTVANIVVETEDGKVPLSELGQVQQKTPQLIIVNMTENPQHTNAAKTAILNSGMNVTPQVEGVTLYLPIQKVTREHREKLAKNAKAICDKCKDKLRNIQNNYDRDLKAQKSKGTHSQDLLLSIHDAIHATTKEYNAKVDEILQAKQNELLKS